MSTLTYEEIESAFAARRDELTKEEHTRGKDQHHDARVNELNRMELRLVQAIRAKKEKV